MVRGGMDVTRHRRGGLTLTELLVAMSILLIGIWAIVQGFPQLFGLIDAEQVRTEMARLCEARLERLKSQPHQLPEAIMGHDPADGSLVHPDSWPDEDAAPQPANPRDDLTWVVGESFEVPAPEAGKTVCAYTLEFGPASIQDPADPGAYLQAWRMAELTRLDEAPPGGSVPEDSFYLDANGYLFAPTQYPSARVDYCWVDDAGIPHWVTHEIVENRAAFPAALPVRATELTGAPAFANVVPEMSSATAMVPYTVAVGGPGMVGPGTVVLEATYGATLLLPAEDAGQPMHINYQMRTEDDSVGNPRRMPIMMEEITAPTQPPYEVNLAFGGIDDQNPLYTEDVLGNPLQTAGGAPRPIFVLVVDSLSGMAWGWSTADPATWIGLDMLDGVLTLDWEHADSPMLPAEARGRELRVYYRVLDGNTITVQKAPDFFVEQIVADTYFDPDPALDESAMVDYRTYTVRPYPDDPTYAQLLFPESAVGQAVVVDYLVGDMSAGNFATVERVGGELHVIDGDAEPSIVLNVPAPPGNGAFAIMGVQGVSLTVRGWWHDERGRVERLGLDTILAPEPLL